MSAEGVRTPRDVPCCGVFTLAIDVTDTVRGIVRARRSVPVAEAGAMTLLYPKWMSGYHSPQNPIELFAGLEIRTGEVLLDWRRDLPGRGLRLPYRRAARDRGGDVVEIEDMLNLQWGRRVLYPAGYYSRGLQCGRA